MLIKNNFLVQSIINNYKKFPNKKIIFDKNKSLTYSQLIKLAVNNSIAVKNINSNYIPIVVDRNIESVVAILSVLFSKKVFCPISSNFPKERIQYILDTINNQNLINCSKDKHVFKNQLKINRKFQKNNFDIDVKNLDETFYLLFTSGSTGKPKGVKLSYKNIQNTLLWSKDYLKWSNHTIGIATEFSFDISMFDLFSGLFYGIPMYIFQNPSDPFTSIKEIRKNNITSVFSVPTFFSNFVKYNLIKKNFNPLKRIISGGDFFSNKDILSWKNNQKNIDIYNVWGPTETSIVNSMYKITRKDQKILLEGKSIPVGKSHRLMNINVLDKKKNAVKKDIIGEICMTGNCVSKGYIGDKKNSNNYFKYRNKNAFLTGDLGYFDKKNYLHIVGRKDNTIKISGYRVDTLEVENLVNLNFKINNSCLVKIDIFNNSILCLFVETNKKINTTKILKFLKEKIPTYSIPKRIISIKKFPLNQNNKVDKNKIKLLLNEK